MKALAMAQGGCFCKTIRFEIDFPTEFVSHCHCQSCRKSHGSAFVTWTAVLHERFRYISGKDKIRRYQSSRAVTWLFCEVCGTSLFYEHADSPHKFYITVANIEGPLDRQPEAHVSYEEHVPWFNFHDDLPRQHGKSVPE